MAPGRVKKFLGSLPFANATRSRRSHDRHGSGAINSTPTTTTEATAAGNVIFISANVALNSNLAPVVTRGEVMAADVVASEPTVEMTGLGDVDTTAGMTLTFGGRGYGLMSRGRDHSGTFRISLDPKKAREYMEDIKRFRVLVMGRANAGKTTILQRVCNTVDKPEIFDGKGKKIDNAVVQGTLGRGYHNIEHELVFQSNPGYVFHDSSGFEAGSTQQFESMKKFVISHATTNSLENRIHAIWYCIPMTDYERTVTAAEQKFFNECDTGHVPVVVLLTKVDVFHLVAVEELLDEGLEMEEAERGTIARASQLLEKWQVHIRHILDRCKFPPKFYLPLTKMHEEGTDCAALIQCTASALNEEGLERLLISTQQSSIALCIEFAMRK
ncbi:hypothetical protein EDD16DRAFT_1720683 [Pisolithus croceorrhizus]|nr:hypothetical protein EDD16DRAFT_1720683 [Pisolithus croceorrhizus]